MTFDPLSDKMPKNVWTYKTPKSKKRKVNKNSVEAVKTLGEYWVEAILDHAFDGNGKLMFFLKWEGYAEDENSWEFDQQLLDCDEARKAFKKTFNGSHPPINSWEEFDNFCDYLTRVTSPSFSDCAVIYKLANKSHPILELKDQKKFLNAKDKINDQIKDLLNSVYRKETFTGRHRNSERLKAIEKATNVAKSLKIKENFGSIRDFMAFVDRRAKIDSKLKTWVNKVNTIIKKEKAGELISVANEMDDEVPTLDNYICSSIFDRKSSVKKESVDEKYEILSCKCRNCYEERNYECCSPIIGFPMAYNSKGLLSHTMANSVNFIFECNQKCKCGLDCPNRVVQRGRKYKLELFRTEDASRGWGVRSLESMPKGAYVSSYIGEVISLTEANQRPTTYLFDLSSSWNQSDNEYTYVIDANKYGNIIRYVNHSCEPNCRMIFVWNNSYDRLLPKVCLFTTRAIRANEELTYDYGMQIINLEDTSEYQHLLYNQSDSISTDSGNASNETDQLLNSAANLNLIDEKFTKVTFKEIACRCGSTKCRGKLYS